MVQVLQKSALKWCNYLYVSKKSGIFAAILINNRYEYTF